MRILVLFLFIASLLFSHCHNQIKKEYLQSLSVLPTSADASTRPCADQLNYIPEIEALEQTPIKYIKVNFHVICNAKGLGNFNEQDGREFIYEVLGAANDKLSSNKKMNLPPNNDTPVLPMQYRYQLTGHPDRPGDDGIYFHDDDDHYFLVSQGKNRNIYNKDVFEKYGIQKDTVLNIFIQGHHLDSLQSKTYKKSIRGIGYPNFVKLNHWYENVVDTILINGRPRVKWHKWNAVKNLHHEVGHSIGLRHTWSGNDGCEDTPHHTNCWNRTKGKAPCDEYWSNNFMDYNAHTSAWSPCQIGIVHRNFADKKKSIRKLLVARWCQLHPDKSITIRKDTDWFGAKDLEGHLLVDEGATLTIHCRVSLPKDAKIVLKPGASLKLNGATLENDCGEQWEGIEIWSKNGLRGEIEVFNGAQILNVRNAVQLGDK